MNTTLSLLVFLLLSLSVSWGQMLETDSTSLAVISYDKQEKHYNFQSYMSNGMSGSFKAELIENKLYWHPADNIRYIIYINDAGQWCETGEMNRNEQWFQFFEMTLDQEE